MLLRLGRSVVVVLCCTTGAVVSVDFFPKRGMMRGTKVVFFSRVLMNVCALCDFQLIDLRSI